LVWPNTNNVTLQGVSSVDTVLDAQTTTRHFYIDYGVGVTIKNIGLVNGEVNTSSEYGGSIYLTNNSSLIVTLDTVIVSGNRAFTGGAIHSAGTNPKVYIYDSSLHGNYADNEGGVVNRTSIYIYKSSFYDNSAMGSAGSEAGAVFYSSTAESYNSEFYNNYAQDGGAINNYGTNTFVNCLMYDNTAANTQGSVMKYGVNKYINCIIINGAGSMFYDAASSYRADMYNTIVVGAFNGNGDFSDWDVKNSIFTDITLPSDMPSLNTRFGFTTADFVDYDAKDFRLISSSVAINNGDNTLWNNNSGNVTADFIAYNRINQPTIDIGCYELQEVVSAFVCEITEWENQPFQTIQLALDALEIMQGING